MARPTKEELTAAIRRVVTAAEDMMLNGEVPGRGAEWMNASKHLDALVESLFENAVCTVPPAGWECSRSPGHEGPCAARRASRQVANKAEVEPFLYTRPFDVENSGLSRFVLVARKPSDEFGIPLYATPPATTGASTALTPERREYYQSWLIADPSGAVERLRAAAQALLDAAIKHEANGEDSDLARATSAVDEALAASVGFVAAGARTVLTDERIKELHVEAFANTAPHERQNAAIRLGRAIEREVAAQAGQVAVPEAARKALQTIARWDLPATGKTWPSGGAISYEAEYGSNGARDYMRQVALAGLKALDASPAVAQQAAPEVIEMLLTVARLAHDAMDGTEENEHGLMWSKDGFEALDAAIAELDALPDDQPGYTMGPAAKARWAMRAALGPSPAKESK